MHTFVNPLTPILSHPPQQLPQYPHRSTVIKIYIFLFPSIAVGFPQLGIQPSLLKYINWVIGVPNSTGIRNPAWTSSTTRVFQFEVCTTINGWDIFWSSTSFTQSSLLDASLVAAEYVLDLLCIIIYETRVSFPCTMRSGLMYRQDIILQAKIHTCSDRSEGPRNKHKLHWFSVHVINFILSDFYTYSWIENCSWKMMSWRLPILGSM